MQRTSIHPAWRVLTLTLAVGALWLSPPARAQLPEPPETTQVLDLLAEGDLLYNDHGYDEALRLYEAASRLDPASPHIRHRLRLAQQREAARQRFLLTVPSEPRARAAFVERHYSEALTLYNDHRLEAAHQRLEEAFFVDPGFRRVHHYLTRVERDLAAVQEVHGGAARPDTPDASADSVNNLPTLDPRPSGLESILITPGYPTHDDLMRRGEAHMEADDIEAAYEVFTRALMTDPNSRAARRARDRAARTIARHLEETIHDRLDTAEEMVDVNRFDGARAVYASVLEVEPGNEEAQEGILALERAQHRAAERERSQLIAMNIDRAGLALRDNQFDAAQTGFESVLALEPDHREAIRGLQRVEAEREQAAAEALERSFDDHLEAARTALRAADFETAIARADQALDLDPANRTAARLSDNVREAQQEATLAAERAATQAAEREQRQSIDSALAQADDIPVVQSIAVMRLPRWPSAAIFVHYFALSC